MSNWLSRVKAFIGPHPYSPPLIFLFFWAFYFSRYVPLLVTQPMGPDRWITGLIIVGLALIPATTFSALAYLWNRFRPWPANKLGFYLLEIFISTTGLNIAFAEASKVQHFETVKGLIGTTVPPTPGFLLMNFLFAVVLFGALHQIEAKLLKRLASADALVAKLEVESRTLVLAEEELKKQVSQFLHDRVQSDLMVVSMQLKSLASQPAQARQEIIDEAISRLESARVNDLRLAIQSLSPNFELTDLEGAIGRLVDSKFSPTKLAVSVVDSVSKFSAEIKMATYRISEQAVLNAQMHGEAENISVTISETADQEFTLVIQDDGSGASEGAANAGVGTAVIDSWARVLSGTKSISTTASGGYRLEVSFKLPKS